MGRAIVWPSLNATTRYMPDIGSGGASLREGCRGGGDDELVVFGGSVVVAAGVVLRTVTLADLLPKTVFTSDSSVDAFSSVGLGDSCCSDLLDGGSSGTTAVLSTFSSGVGFGVMPTIVPTEFTRMPVSSTFWTVGGLSGFSGGSVANAPANRSEEHTSELQSRFG